MRCLRKFQFLGGAVRHYFVEFQKTPSPSCMKFFVKGVSFLSQNEPTLSFTRETAYQSPLAEAIFVSPDAVEVTIGTSFVTVRKGDRETEETSELSEQDIKQMAEMKQMYSEYLNSSGEWARPVADWSELSLAVVANITNHLFSNRSHVALDAPHPHQDTLPADTDSEVVASIKELIATIIRPQLQEDGGDVRFLDYDSDRRELRVEFLGTCRQCKNAATTLHDLLERTVRHWIPEVQSVVEIKSTPSGVNQFQ